MVVLRGGTVADVYTGTYVDADVVIEDGRIVHVGPDAPGDEVVDVRGKVVVPGYIEPHAHPWCLYGPTSLLEAAIPDGTTTLVYDNLFFFLSHGVEGLRSIVDQMNAAPAHVSLELGLKGPTATLSSACPQPRPWHPPTGRSASRPVRVRW